jgi:hypothetical protein
MSKKTYILLVLTAFISLSFIWENEKHFVLPVKSFHQPSNTLIHPVVFKNNIGGPIELTWKTLTDVQFKDIYVKELDAYYWKPTFGASILALEGKEVFITGYIIPVDYDANFYVVSRYPYANCFFCGGGGPESVVDLRFPGKHPAYKTDERKTFKGKLKLNGTDVYQMNYILEGATEFKP